MNLLNLFRQVNTAMREEDFQREIELNKNAKTKVRSGAEGVPKQCNKDCLVEIYKGTKFCFFFPELLIFLLLAVSHFNYVCTESDFQL